MPTIALGGNDYPSYASVAEADASLAVDVFRAVGWATRDASAKARGLVSATRLMQFMPWCAPAPDAEDAGPLDPILVEVTSALAADLLAKPALVVNAGGNSNIKSAKAGSAQVEFFAPVAGAPPIERVLWNRLIAAGLLCFPDTSALDGPIVSGICGEYRPLEGRYSTEYWIAAMDCD